MNVDKNVPFPIIETRGRPRKYPFRDMYVGDSVFFDGEKIGPKCRPYAAAKMAGLQTGMKFVGRTVDGGVRIWRIE